MSQTLDDRARDASHALRAAAEIRPTTTRSKRTHATRRVALAAAIVVAAVLVGSVIAFRGPSNAPVGHRSGAQTIAEANFSAAVHGAPYHVFAPTAPGLTLFGAEGERGKDSDGHEVYTVDLWYTSAHGTFHLWMAERRWSTSVLHSDLATTGRPTTIAGEVWHLVTLPRPHGTQLQLARATSDGAVIEIDGPFDLHTMSIIAASLH